MKGTKLRGRSEAIACNRRQAQIRDSAVSGKATQGSAIESALTQQADFEVIGKL